MNPSYDIVIVKIEEMKKTGAWTEKDFDKNLLTNMGPFGGNTMSFENWLQFVFIPRVKEIVNNKGNFPTSSSVGAYAIRELDGRHEYSYLIQLLCEFEKLFGEKSSEHQIITSSKQRGIYRILVLMTIIVAFGFILYTF